MLPEIQAGAKWWTEQLRRAANAQNLSIHFGRFQAFQRALVALLEDKYAQHWYPKEPRRGQAYRALLNEPRRPDPLLYSALLTARLPIFLTAHMAEAVMWIDSGSVAVEYRDAPNKTVRVLLSP